MCRIGVPWLSGPNATISASNHVSQYKNDTLLKSSHNLLLLGRSPSSAPRELNIYMTEGPKSKKYPNFTTAMQVILFKWTNNTSTLNSTNGEPDQQGIIECTLSTVVRSAVATNSEIDMSSEYADYFDYQVLANGTKESSLPLALARQCQRYQRKQHHATSDQDGSSGR